MLCITPDSKLMAAASTGGVFESAEPQLPEEGADASNASGSVEWAVPNELLTTSISDKYNLTYSRLW